MKSQGNDIDRRVSLARLLGIDDLLAAPRSPISAETLWVRTFDFGRVEKVRVQESNSATLQLCNFATFLYICHPLDAPSAPRPVFLCLQGHSTGMHKSIGVDWQDETTRLDIPGDRDFAIGCLKRGISAVCIEQRAMGENSGNADRRPGCFVPAMHALLAGRTLLGLRIYDVDRVIDYLETRPDIDLSRLGIMGNSGGGTTSMFAAPLLPRITHAMPSCAFSSFHASIGAMEHCSCNYVPGLYDWGESADVLALAAPKPVIVVNGRHDPIFPLVAADAEFERLHAAYAEQGAADRCVHVVGEGEHRFYADPAWEAMLPLWNS